MKKGETEREKQLTWKQQNSKHDSLIDWIWYTLHDDK